ncbi:hypothetical protein SteCoe_219 [Stentor coeruleus]|uniref:Uncharacterized protein n=1 Tax=Stentor coeruleus TaxID=5963 RepID=A0A1R2D4R3_9CILI|nr:hypothetical protein SteCoe_219 [Stentor coeruleus]
MQDPNDNPIKSFDSDKIHYPKREKNPNTSEYLFYKNSDCISVPDKSLKVIKSLQPEDIQSLQLENSLLKTKLNAIIRLYGLNEGKNSYTNSEKSQEFIETVLKNLKNDIFHDLDQHLSVIFTTFSIKANDLSNKLQNAISTIQNYKNKLFYTQKASKLKEKTLSLKIEELEKSYSQTILETQNLIKSLQTELKISKSETISPIVTISIQDLELNPNSTNPNFYLNHDFQKNYQDQILTNIQLKSDILNNEGKLTSLKQLEENHKKLQQKFDFLEKVNKELTIKKNDLENSLNLDCNNLKEMVEIQELRTSLRIISEKYNQEKETILKDCGESRQDIETQMFRLQNEKTYIEIKLKDTEKILTEITREKDRLEGTVGLLKKDIERFKDCKNQDKIPKGIFSKYAMELVQISNSDDFELTESVDKFAAVNSNDLYEMLLEEINELAMKIKDNQLVNIENMENKSNKDVIIKFIEIGVKVKGVVCNDSVPGMVIKDLAECVYDMINKYKVKIRILEEENAEKDKKIEAVGKMDKLEVMSEPSPRILGTCALDSSCYMKKQLQIQKIRVSEKKHAIQLYKEQIACLKQNVRELQMELDRVYDIDIGQVKKFWWSFGKEIPWLKENAEDMMEVYSKMLGFDGKEYQVMKNERKNKRSKKRFGFF